MARMGKFSVSGLAKLQRNLGICQKEREQFLEACAKELAARLLSKVIKRTPVGQYEEGSGKVGGTLRRGWTSKSHEEAASGGKSSAATYVGSLKINHFGNAYVIELTNPVAYASYVEYGHRTASHKGWVPGRFMLTISEQEIQDMAPNVLEAKVKKYLEGCIK